MSERKADARVLPVIVDRWSPRAFDATPVPPEDLAVIFEAAGLAPSAFNIQPWRFLYAVPGDANWATFLDILVPFNQSWAKDAGALVFILSQETSAGADGKANPIYSHSFDAGSAWALMSIQATAMGYHTHGMAGLDHAKARDVLGIPDGFRLEAAAVIGRRGEPDKLPEPLRARENPSGRKPVEQYAVAGRFSDLPG